MLVPATLLHLFCHLLVSVQAETYARVNFTLRCDSPEPFRYTATLIKKDHEVWYTDDLIAKNSGEALFEHIDYVAGLDDGDGWLNYNYEFDIIMEHNCGGGEKQTVKRKLPDCSIYAARCDFRQIFYLN